MSAWRPWGRDQAEPEAARPGRLFTSFTPREPLPAEESAAEPVPDPLPQVSPAEPLGLTLTDAQLQELAALVAARVATTMLGEQMRDSIRRIVSETAERLVREEIARIRADADPESQA